MARNRRGRMALYEVMSKAKDKPGYGRTLEKIRPGKPSDEEPMKDKDETVAAEAAVENDAAEFSADQTTALEEQERIDDGVLAVQWRRKPRIVQYNNGRVEFSVPYQIGIAAVLGLVVVMLLAFRAGQRSVVGEKAVGGSPPAKVGVGRRIPVMSVNEGSREAAKAPKGTAVEGGNAVAPSSTGSNVIVLAQYRSSRDLAPVQAHFASYGIATKIVASGGQYFLVTQSSYSGQSLVAGSGGDGELAIQKIAEVGAAYRGKAPEGYETFAPHYFGDAYGKKVE
jgi:hypothetical protein